RAPRCAGSRACHERISLGWEGKAGPLTAVDEQLKVKLIAGHAGSSAWLGCGWVCRRATGADRDFVTTPLPPVDDSGRKHPGRAHVARLSLSLKMPSGIRPYFGPLAARSPPSAIR